MVIEKIKESSKPTYYEFFIMLGRLNNGVKFLIDFRSDVNTSIQNCKNLDEKKKLM